MDSTITQPEIKNEIISAINSGQDLVFISYSILEETEKNIQFALAKILEKFKKQDYLTPVYSSVKELIANAVKANAKFILIKEGEIENPDDPMEVVTRVRKILNEEALLRYGVKSKKYRLSTRVYLKMQGRKLIIDVINNLPLSAKELKRIHERIEKSSHYDSIAEFYMENPDPIAEGMGLGLSMVVVLLKSIDIPHNNFAVYTDEEHKTTARLVIPL